MTNGNIAHKTTPYEEALPIGTTLSGEQFTITDHLGAGGFGITYRATDNVLGRTIVIKECFPTDLCVRDRKTVVARNSALAKPFGSVVQLFMREARSLAKLRHPNIVGVHRAFEENGTAYMALDLIDGRDLFDILDTGTPRLSPRRIVSILMQLLDAIEKVHEMDLLHRDISPDNIILEKSGTPVLIDFGAARADANRHTRALSSLLVVKDGYSPQEFYVAGSEQTPSSDLYALGATFYHVISGAAPPNSQKRMVEIAGNRPDPCVPLAGRIEGYDQDFLATIDRAMSIHPGDRMQSAAMWRSLIDEVEIDKATSSTPRPRSLDLSLDLEQSLSRLVEETNDEVRRISQIPEEPTQEPAPPPDPPKPEWVEEFNRDALSPAVASEPTPVAPEAAEPDTPANTADAQPAVPPSDTDTNWIDRAAAKQERLRIERERQLQLFLDDATRDTANDPLDAEDPQGTPAPPPGPGIMTRLKAVGTFLGLAGCFYVIFFFERIVLGL